MDVYIWYRQLRWAGHVARMGHERLPRKFLTSWVRHPRPHGRPQFTYGHSLNKTLARAGFPSEFKEWTELAQNRELWRARVYGLADTQPPLLCAHHHNHILFTRSCEQKHRWLDWGFIPADIVSPIG